MRKSFALLVLVLFGLSFVGASVSAEAAPLTDFYRGVYAECIWQLVGDEPVPDYVIRICEARIENYRSVGWERFWETIPVDRDVQLGGGVQLNAPTNAPTPTRLGIAQTNIAALTATAYRSPTPTALPFPDTLTLKRNGNLRTAPSLTLGRVVCVATAGIQLPVIDRQNVWWYVQLVVHNDNVK